ncbi:MAG: glycosyltransferase family 39 protein [Acidobacteria bacterium]|nr:glycosyltransferase family 39 protein [Acidobacteriota bacterium]
MSKVSQLSAKSSLVRWLYAVWVVVIGVFAVLHALNLAADFPNHTPWHIDWAKYTDEGWYGNAAVRAHLFGNWYVPGDFNPAPAVPLWPFLEWVLFFFTGVNIEAARGLAVGFFFANLILSYALIRPRAPKWVALLALTLMVTSPFLYCFSRLAILEPMLTTLMLAALNLAVRLPQIRRPVPVAAGIGVLFTLMMLTKTTAIFLLPALGWAIFAAFRERGDVATDSARSSLRSWFHLRAMRCAATATVAFAFTFGAWMALVIALGYFGDYKYLLFINKYIKPTEFYWPLLSFWWSLHASIWVDRILMPLAGLLIAAVLLSATLVRKRATWASGLLIDPVFGACVLAAGGYILFMTYQNHPQPRYFALVAVFCFVIIAMSIGKLSEVSGLLRIFAYGAAALTLLASLANGIVTTNFASHPEYTFVNAARSLTRFIDQHPNGNRLLVSISGDEITLITHLQSLCDDFSTRTPEFPDLSAKLDYYKPGWWATWNDIDPGTLEDLHTHYSLEQVAKFKAFDDEERNVIVLFKLHPLPEARVIEGNNLQQPLPGDKIDIVVE